MSGGGGTPPGSQQTWQCVTVPSEARSVLKSHVGGHRPPQTPVCRESDRTLRRESSFNKKTHEERQTRLVLCN